MVGKILTDDNKELLKIIYYYGGYIRVSHLGLIYPNITPTSQFRKLNKLKEMGYLTARRLKTESKKEPITYQVTKPTCRMFFNPDSYYRKKHQEEYIYRALIKSYFCCELHNELGDQILADHDDRVQLFMKGNFNKELFPRKYNKDDSFIHFEEFQINFTQTKGKKLINNDELLYDDLVKRTIIVYIDQYYKNVRKQMITFINKYINLVQSGGDFLIDFLIVVDDEDRKLLYQKEIQDFLKRHVYKDRLSDQLIKYYRDFLVKNYEQDTVKVNEINESYLNGKLKKDILERVSNTNLNIITDQQKSIAQQVNIKGETYIIERLKNIVKTAGNFQAAYDILEQFFNNLFILEYYNYFSLSSGERKKKFDIKVYKIGQKIYQ